MSFTKNLSTLFTCFLLIIGLVWPLPAETYKMGVVDSDRLIEETAIGQKAKGEFLSELENIRKILAQKQKRIKILQDSLILAQQIDDEKSSINKQRKKLAREIEEYKQIETLLQRRLQKKDMEVADKLRQKVKKILRQHFIQERGYTIILEKQDTAVIADSIDITDEIIKVLNRELPETEKDEE